MNRRFSRQRRRRGRVSRRGGSDGGGPRRLGARSAEAQHVALFFFLPPLLFSLSQGSACGIAAAVGPPTVRVWASLESSCARHAQKAAGSPNVHFEGRGLDPRPLFHVQTPEKENRSNFQEGTREQKFGRFG